MEEFSEDVDKKSINLLEDADADNLFVQLSAKFAAKRREIANLEARVLSLERENVGLKSENSIIPELRRENSELQRENSDLKLGLTKKELDLKEAKAFLGHYVLTASRQGHTNSVAGPSRLPVPSSKRARSHSLENLESPHSSRKRFREHSVVTPVKFEAGSPPQPSSPTSSVLLEHRSRTFKQGANANPASAAENVKSNIPREAIESPPTGVASSGTTPSTSSAPELPKQTQQDDISPPEEQDPNAPAKDAFIFATHGPSTVATSTTASSTPARASVTPKPIPLPTEGNARANVKAQNVVTLPNADTTANPSISSSTSFSMSSLALESKNEAAKAQNVVTLPKEHPPTVASSRTTASTPSSSPKNPQPAHAQSNPAHQEDTTRVTTKPQDAVSLLKEGPEIASSIPSSTTASSMFSSAPENPKQIVAQSKSPPEGDGVGPNATPKAPSTLAPVTLPTGGPTSSGAPSKSSLAPENTKHSSAQLNSAHENDIARPNTNTKEVHAVLNKDTPIAAAGPFITSVVTPPKEHLIPVTSSSSISSTPSSAPNIPQPAHAQSNPTHQEDNTRSTTKAQDVVSLLKDPAIANTVASSSTGPSMSSSESENTKQGTMKPNPPPEANRVRSNLRAEVVLTLAPLPTGGPASSGASSKSSLASKNMKRSRAQPNSAHKKDTGKQNANPKVVRATRNQYAPIVGHSSTSSSNFPSAGEHPKPPSDLSGMTNFYLKLAESLTITPPPPDLDVPRAFLRLAYGGSDQQWLQHIPADRNPCGQVERHIVFPKQQLNPAMPTAPGQPGLIFAGRHEILSNPPWMIFCKQPAKSPIVWRYLGEYECVLCGTMTAEQFTSLTPEVKREWAKALLTTKKFDVYVAMRARIALRKAGSIPEEDKKMEEKLVKAEMEAVKWDKGLPVTADDILAGLSNGDEVIDIIRVTCVKYDHVFANHMNAKFPDYPAMLADHQQKKARGKVKSKSKKAGGSKEIATAKQSPEKGTSKAQLQIVDLDEGDSEDIDMEDMSGDAGAEYMVPFCGKVETSTTSVSLAQLRPRRSIRKPARWADDAADDDILVR